MTDLLQSLDATVKSAPELSESPGLAVGVATSGGDTGGNAQATARASNAVSEASGKAQVAASTGDGLSEALNWFGDHVNHVVGDVAHDVTTGATTVAQKALTVVNAPLALVQHEYRYLHDVEVSHGMLPAILEGIGLAAGAAGGAILTGGSIYGAEIGAEAVGAAEGQVSYRDSWQRTGSASYVDPRTHDPVSLGRDFMHLVGLRPGTEPFKVTSGLIDGMFDISLGGTEEAGLFKAARAGTLGGAVGGKLGDMFSVAAPQDGADLLHVYQANGSVRRAFDDIAGKSAAQIALTPAYANLARNSGNGFLAALGRAQTGEQVAQVFSEALAAHTLAYTDKLPSILPTRVPFQKLREISENSTGPAGVVAKAMRALPESWATAEGKIKSISNHEFNPADPLDNGAVGLGNMLMLRHSRATAAAILDRYINAPDLASRVEVYRQSTLDLLFNMAGFHGSRQEFLDQFTNPIHQKEMAKVLDELVAGGDFGKESIYSMNDEGRVTSLIKSRDQEWQYGAAVHPNQTGSLRFLDPNEAIRAAKALENAQSIFEAEGRGAVRRALAGGDYIGRVGDFAYHHITQGIFKPLVLLTPSYALHIALAELIPNTLRNGVFNTVKSGLAVNIAKLGYKDYAHGAAEDALNAAQDALGVAQASGDRARMALAEKRVTDATQVLHKAGYQSKMDQAIAGLSWRMLDHLSGGHIEELLRNPDEIASTAMGKRLQLAARYIEFNDGAVPSALLSGHYSATEKLGGREELTARMTRKALASSNTHLGENFIRFGPDTPGQVDAWQAALREQANDPASRLAASELIKGARNGGDLDTASGNAAREVAKWMRSQPEGTFDWALRSNPNIASVSQDGRPYVSSFVHGLPDGMDQYDDWAKVLVDDMRSVTRGQDGTLHVPLLHDIANGTWTDRHALDAIPTDSRPRYVKGQEVVPDGSSKVQRIANIGFRRALNPMVNFLSRQPIAFTEFEKQYGRFAEAVDRGTLSEDEAMTLAMNNTVRNVIRNVHNIYDRTQWSATLRNWAPFYFAQEQAYRRFGRLLAENPAAFRKYALMIANIHNVGNIFQGQNGQGYFVVPGTGWISHGVTDALTHIGISPAASSAVGMGWNLTGSSVIFPLSNGIRPDLGPLVAVPIQQFAQMFPEMGAPALKADVTAAENVVLGSSASTSPIWSQLIPNTIAQRIATAIDPGVDERSFDSAMMQTMLSLDYEGKIPPANAGYMKWQQFIDRVKNQTRIMYVAKALIGAVTPVSPEITDVTYDKFSGELAQDIQKYGSVTKGITEFLTKNPDATPFTVFESYSPTGSAPPDSVEAQNWIDNNGQFINDHPYSAFYFMPQLTDNKYNSTVYNEQLAQGYRVKYNPDANPVGNIGSSFLAQLYIAAGNSFILDNPENYPAYKAQIATMGGQEKYAAEQQWYNEFLPAYGAKNPIWWQYWQANTKSSDRTQAIQEIQQMVQTNTVPNATSKQSQGIVGLMHDYEGYQNNLAAGYQNNFVGQTQSDLDQQWTNYLTSVAQDNPELRTFINGVFMTLPAKLGGTGG